MTPSTLDAEQKSALLDILSHAEVYSEIHNFRNPGTLATYGPPFNHSDGKPSTSPSLQALLSKFVLTLPGLRDASKEFWQDRIYNVVEDLEKAELSESFDKGNLGIRKTLATAASALIEYPVRGVFGGLEKLAGRDGYYEYDTTNSEDLSRAFRDFLHQAVYGDVIDDLMVKAAETDKLSDHLPIVQAAHEYILVNLASFMHYALVLSPKGQYLLTLIDHANKLVPYAVIKQTLRIGNVASMINAMMKVVLAKMSVASVTNWMGWTQTADEGMNLMQHIISTVLHWDVKDLKSRASKIEKDRNGLEKEQLETLKAYGDLSRADHERSRQRSELESRSITSVILSEASVASDLAEAQQNQALDYLAIQLAIRDREQITKVLCHTQPDHLTEAVRDVVAAYEPVIRSVHNAVDLSETVTDFENFLKDMMHVSKLRHKNEKNKPQNEVIVPTVGDYVRLLKKHQSSCHKFLHQCAKNGKEVTGWFHDWARSMAATFRRDSDSGHSSSKDFGPSIGEGAPPLASDIESIFGKLPKTQRDKILPTIDAHAKYLAKLHAASALRLALVVNSPASDSPHLRYKPHQHLFQSLSRPSSRPPSSPSSRSTSPTCGAPSQPPLDSDLGPGTFLARWQALLDDTAITPATTKGAVRYGRNKDVQQGSKVDVDGESKRDVEAPATNSSGNAAKPVTTGEQGLNEDEKVQRPDVQAVVDALLPAFKELLARRACSW